MKHLTIIFSLLLFFLLFNNSTRTPSSSKINQTKLCQYDNYCMSIYDENSDVYKVAPSIKKLLSFLSDDIKKTAQEYQVDPRAIAGVIAAEHTLNVSIEDDIQNFLANYGVTSVFGKKFSYGLGQIFPRVAIEVEPLVAKVEKRKPYTRKQVVQALTKPKESLKYMAAIIKNIQNQYSKSGFDISNNIGVLTTLYNIGDIDKRLKKTPKNKKLLPNYFGVFILTNLTDIEDCIGWSLKQGNYSPKFYSNDDTYYEHNFLFKPITSYLAPDFCKAVIDRQNNSIKNIKTSYYSNKPIDGFFKVLRTTLSCKTERWSLLEFIDGPLGWVKNSDLNKFSTVSNLINTPQAKSNNCPLQSLKTLSFDKNIGSSINDYFKSNCYVDQTKPLPETNKSQCNFDIINSVKLIIKTLNSSTCHNLVLIPNKYLYNYIWEKHPSLKSKILLNNLPSNSFGFTNATSKNNIKEFLPQPN